MRATRTLSLLLVALFFTSCGTQSPASQIKREVQTVYSWAETAKMVCEDWTNGALPTRYARRTLQIAQESMRDEVESFGKSNVPADQRGKLLGQMQSLENIFGQMQSAISRGDSGGLAEPLRQLTEIQQQVNSLKQSGGTS